MKLILFQFLELFPVIRYIFLHAKKREKRMPLLPGLKNETRTRCHFTKRYILILELKFSFGK